MTKKMTRIVSTSDPFVRRFHEVLDSATRCEISETATKVTFALTKAVWDKPKPKRKAGK